jgi:hypothetical protein
MNSDITTLSSDFNYPNNLISTLSNEMYYASIVRNNIIGTYAFRINILTSLYFMTVPGLKVTSCDSSQV